MFSSRHGYFWGLQHSESSSSTFCSTRNANIFDDSLATSFLVLLSMLLRRRLTVLEEAQICYAIRLIQHMQSTGITSFDPKRDVQTKWHDDLQARLKETM